MAGDRQREGGRKGRQRDGGEGGTARRPHPAYTEIKTLLRKKRTALGVIEDGERRAAGG